MKASDLIARLTKLDPSAEVMILDGHNGGGEPREINLGPSQRVITQANADDGADCEGRVGETIFTLGYGCY